MLYLRYELIFDPENIDQDCDKIAGIMSDEGEFIKEALDAGLYKQAVMMYFLLLKSMCDHFVKDEMLLGYGGSFLHRKMISQYRTNKII